jgi:hypothetical protein
MQNESPPLEALIKRKLILPYKGIVFPKPGAFNLCPILSRTSIMAKTTKTTSKTTDHTAQAMQAISDFMNPETLQGKGDEKPAKARPYVSLDSAREKEVTLTPYAIDLWYPGCKSAEAADKMIAFCTDEQDLDTYLALLMSQGGYVQIVKEAEEEDGPLIGPAEFMLPRIYFEPNSSLQSQAVDINIRAAALWFEYKFGCTDAEKELRKLIEESK